MIPIILSGGGGSRLWPVSRPAMPKQFAALLNESLFNKTANRLKVFGEPWVITVREMQTLTERALQGLQLPCSQVLIEPFGKNTAAAVAFICWHFQSLGRENEIVGIFPADHLIDDEPRFLEAVVAGEKLAASGNIVTLGVEPTYPATGYGYIETGGSYNGDVSGARLAVRFREKPNEETAREFLGRGGFYWNAGMFIFPVTLMIAMFKKYAPEIWEVISTTDEARSNIDSVYARVRSTSIDYAIMERLESHICIPCRFGWSDLGSWDSMTVVLDDNAVNKTEVEGSDNFVIPFGDKTYGFVGVDDLVVVDTVDALLITKKGATENVKQLVDKMQSQKPSKRN